MKILVVLAFFVGILILGGAERGSDFSPGSVSVLAICFVALLVGVVVPDWQAAKKERDAMRRHVNQKY
jgi:Na+/alanine symporter